MSPESELNAATNKSQAADGDGLQRASDVPGRRLVLAEKGSGLLPKEQATTWPSLVFICSWVAVAGAAAFVACGLWQVGAIISQAREIAHEVVAARAAMPSNGPPRAGSALAALPVSAAADPVPRLRRGEADAAPVRPENAIDGSAHPMLTVAANTTKAGAPAAAFEAQAEAPERVVPIGLEPALDDASSELRLGYPPPAEFPRAQCADIFVYIVTIAEEAPERSAASIGVGKKGPARFRRPGDEIGDWTVVAISDDWTGLNPGVWLEKDGTVCRAELAGNPSRVHQRPKPPTRRKARRRRR